MRSRRSSGHRRLPLCAPLPLSGLPGVALSVPGVGLGDAFAKGNSRPPPQGVEAGDVQQLPWRDVRLGGIESQLPGEADHIANELGQLANGDVLAHADVDDGGFILRSPAVVGVCAPTEGRGYADGYRGVSRALVQPSTPRSIRSRRCHARARGGTIPGSARSWLRIRRRVARPV